MRICRFTQKECDSGIISDGFKLNGICFGLTFCDRVGCKPTDCKECEKHDTKNCPLYHVGDKVGTIVTVSEGWVVVDGNDR